MRTPISEEIEIPEGTECRISSEFLECNRQGNSLRKKIIFPKVNAEIEGRKIRIFSASGNKNEHKKIKSEAAHIRNIFRGLNEKYLYTLEACNVHFPMTLKIEGDVLVISNFLGEKVPRRAKILPGVNIEIKGQKITLISCDRDSAGQTAANIERATKITHRDRRVFQDGIFITGRPGGAK